MDKDLAYEYIYVNPFDPSITDDLEYPHVGIDGRQGGKGDCSDDNKPAKGESYSTEEGYSLNPIDNSMTAIRSFDDNGAPYGVGSDVNGVGGGGGASVASVSGETGYGYGGKGSQSADPEYLPT